MTTPDQQGDTPQPVTREQLETLTADELVAQYNVTRARKADMVDAVLANGGQPFADDSDTVVLAIVNTLVSQEHYYDPKADPITAEGTKVPADQAEQIIADAASGGVIIREVN